MSLANNVWYWHRAERRVARKKILIVMEKNLLTLAQISSNPMLPVRRRKHSSRAADETVWRKNNTMAAAFRAYNFVRRERQHQH